MMHPVKHQLSNNLIWMSRELRNINDAATITNWIGAMQLVYTLLNNCSENTNMAWIENQSSKEQNLTQPPQKVLIENNKTQQYITSESKETNNKQYLEMTISPPVKRLVVKGKRSLPPCTTLKPVIPDKVEASEVQDRTSGTVAIVPTSVRLPTAHQRLVGKTVEEGKLRRKKDPNVEYAPAPRVKENIEWSDRSEMSRKNRRDCLRRILQRKGMEKVYLFGNKWATYMFELVLRHLGYELNFDNALSNKSFRCFVKREINLYFNPD